MNITRRKFLAISGQAAVVAAVPTFALASQPVASEAVVLTHCNMWPGVKAFWYKEYQEELPRWPDEWPGLAPQFNEVKP